MLRRAFALSVASLILPVTPRAQEPARDSLPAVVITATRVRVATVAPTASTTVLRGEDLRAQGIRRLADALRLVPGAAVVASGSMGSQTSLFLRGGNSNYVRLLVDGVAVNDAGGSVDLAAFALDNVDRIEVVRGPASVLYGSDAVTGVVQVFTREGAGPFAVHGAAGAGSRGARRGEAGFTAGSTSAGVSMHAGRESTNGTLPFNNEFTTDVLSASAHTVRATSDARLAVRWSSASFHYPTEYDGAVVDRNAEQADHRLVASLEAGRRLGRAEVRLALGASEFLPRTNDGPDGPADTLGFFGFYSRSVRTRRSADARLNVPAGRATLTLGLDVARERERSSTRSLSEYGTDAGGFEAARHNTGVSVQVLGDASARLSYVAGARVDENSAFGTFHTARASVAMAVTPAVRLRASIGNAFKAPSFFENFSTGFVTGNPALRPERSRSGELGLDVALARGALTVRSTAYVQRFQDVVQYTATAPSAGAPNYYNVAAADANGTELQAELRAGAYVLGLAFSWTDTRATRSGFDSTAGATYVVGQPLIRRPPRALTLSAARSIGSAGTVRLLATRIGARDDRDFATFPVAPVVLPAYTTVDVATELPLPGRRAAGSTIVVRVENLLDAAYQEIARFDAPRRTVFVGVRSSF